MCLCIERELVYSCVCELGWIHKVTNNLGLLQVLPSFPVTSLNTVLAQGMNLKKKHEVGH